MSRPCIVELVGLPGAGKSTVATRLLESVPPPIRVAGREVVRTLRGRRTGTLEFLARHPALAFDAGALLQTAAVRGADAVRHLSRLASWGSRLDALRMSALDLVVLDQGIVQQGWSVATRLGPAHHERIARLVTGVLRATAARPILVLCDLPPETAFDRVSGRADGRSALDGMPQAQALPLLRDAQPSLESLTTAVSGAVDLPLLHLDTTAELEVAVGRLRDFLRETAGVPLATASSSLA